MNIRGSAKMNALPLAGRGQGVGVLICCAPLILIALHGSRHGVDTPTPTPPRKGEGLN